MKMHNGQGNGQGFIFADEPKMTLEKGGTTLHSVCKAPRGLEELNTTYTFSNRLHVDEMIAVLEAPIYRGTPKLKQLAYLKVGYKGKNENGGRSCKMITPSSYKNRAAGPCIPWGTMVQPAVHWAIEEPRSYDDTRDIFNSVLIENVT